MTYLHVHAELYSVYGKGERQREVNRQKNIWTEKADRKRVSYGACDYVHMHLYLHNGTHMIVWYVHMQKCTVIRIFVVYTIFA